MDVRVRHWKGGETKSVEEIKMTVTEDFTIS
jgi:hypothetical protein